MKNKLSWFHLLIIVFTLLISIIVVLAYAYGELAKLEDDQSELQETIHSLSIVNIRIQSLLIDEYVEQRYEDWKESRIIFENKLKQFSQLSTILNIKSKHRDFVEKEQSLYSLLEVNQEDAKLIENDLLVLFQSGELAEFDTLQSFKAKTGTRITVLIENIRSFQIVRTTMEAIFKKLAAIINAEIESRKQNIQVLGIITSLLLLVAIIMLVIFRSITMIKEKELTDQRNVELQRVNQIKDSFLANTSHELRTPLSGIIGLGESLLEGIGGPITQAQANDLKMIIQGGRRLSHLVNDILDFSKMKHQDIEITLQPVDIHSVTEVVLALSKPLVKSKPVKLVNSITSNTPAVMADEDRVQQILYNLIGNAIKFTESGSIVASAEKVGENLKISITDTGIGIAGENFKSIFESFEQTDSSIERVYGGTGLGLAISKQLIELQGGSIQVESTLGKGSRFIFALPLTEEKVDKTQISLEISKILDFEESEEFDVEVSSSEKVTAHDNPFRILIVDDDPINLKVLTNYLSLENYSCVKAMNGQGALDAIQKYGKPDLMLLDVMMPKMSGFEVCRILRKKYPANELPIILLTAKSLITDLVEGFSTGANDYLVKPFSKHELLVRISSHLQVSKIHNALLRSKKEKETLLHEIHHRVKNNMQVISSLLRLQADGIDDDRIKAALFESQNRILAMATVHENLYKSKYLSHISISPFFKKIAESVITSYRGSLEKTSFDIDSDDLYISIKQASPLGLILNELVSNSLKHAFPDGHDGIINVKIKQMDDDHVQVHFSDNGIGMPDSIDWRNTESLGLKLVINLLENQLQGSVQMETNNGTQFFIQFMLDQNPKK
jgi:signal transduction histidine kinase